MREQNNVIDKETEAIKKEPNRNPGAEEYNNWNSLDGVRQHILSNRISELEGRSFDIIESEEQKQKRIKKSEKSLRDV